MAIQLQLVFFILAGAAVGSLSGVKGFWLSASLLLFGFILTLLTWQAIHSWPGLDAEFFFIATNYLIAVVAGIVIGGVLISPRVRKRLSNRSR